MHADVMIRRCTGIQSRVLCSFGSLVCFLAGCSSDSPSPETMVGAPSEQRDSAGTLIVSSSVGETTPRWVVSQEPDLRLGSVDGSGPDVFARIAFAARLSDGGLVVADGASNEIRFFESDGSFVRRVGRRGGGPAEFGEFSRIVRLPGDTLVVYDLVNRRTSRVSPEGSLISENSLADMLSAQTELGRRPVVRAEFHAETSGDRHRVTRWRNFLLAGPVAGGGHAIAFSAAPPATSVGVGDTIRALVEVLVADEANLEARVLAAVQGPLSVTMVVDEGPRGTFQIKEVVPFANEPLMATHRDRVIVSSDDRYELRIYDSSGHLERLIRRADVVPVSVDDQLRRSFVAWAIARPGARIESYEREFATTAFAVLGESHLLPTLADILTDEQGLIWVRDALLPWEENSPHTYSVFDLEGAIVATATLPGHLRVVDIGTDHITGVVWDELDVEHVHIYSIRREQ